MKREKASQKPRKSKSQTHAKPHKGRRKKPIRLLFGTGKNIRHTLARLIRDFNEHPRANVQRFRAFTYSIRTMGELLSMEKQDEILRRLEMIEAGMKGLHV